MVTNVDKLFDLVIGRQQGRPLS